VNVGVEVAVILGVGEVNLVIGVGTARTGRSIPRKYVTAISIRQDARCSTHGI